MMGEDERGGIDVETEFVADGGNVKARIIVDEFKVAFLATPAKIRLVADAMIRAATDAEGQMPHG